MFFCITLLVFSKLATFAANSVTTFLTMKKQLSIKKGLSLPIAGALEQWPSASAITTVKTKRVAVIPDDFPGLTLKASVREGDRVEAGTPLLHDKNDAEIAIVSPAAGSVEAIVRGERRKILRVVVTVDETGGNPVAVDTSDIRRALKLSGIWAQMRQLPYAIVPDSAKEPRDIFIAGFDTAPLATSLEKRVSSDALARGIAILSKLTKGKVYVSRGEGSEMPDIAGAVMIDIKGPHPAGNVGVMVNHISPVNKGQTVWTLDIVTAARIGELFINKGVASQTTLVAVTGPEIEKHRIVEALIGSEIKPILEKDLEGKKHHVRIVSGNLLTGVSVGADGFLRFPWRQLTVIAEGDDVDEFMGWATLSPRKMSFNRSFPGRFLHRLFRPDARLNGGRRAMIMSGVYDRVFPMDIMPEPLIKAFISKNLEKMEALGGYEVAPEDFALAEVIDPSKLELQRIAREGLEYMRREL